MLSGAVSPQGAYSTFVYSYAVEKPLSVGHKVAGYLPSLFWGFLTLGQLVSIPISSKIRPATMVFVNMVSGRLLLLGSPGEPPWPPPQDVCSGLDSASRMGLWERREERGAGGDGMEPQEAEPARVISEPSLPLFGPNSDP